jgi:uncharacterized protein with PQ loop repeat
MAGEGTFTNVYDWLGFFGGLMFAVGLLPQLYKQIKTRSSRDISLAWQFAYIVGVTLYGIYTINYRLWPILAPTAMEFVVIWMSIVVKCITDRKRREKERLEAPASSSKVEVVGHKLATQTTAVDQKDLADVDLEMQSTYTEDRTPSACKPP